MKPIVLKFGGELLEESARLATVVDSLMTLVRRGTPMVVVHGGGKEIDAGLTLAGIAKQQVEGLRVTNDRTLEVVVSVLAGAINTRFVAALTTAGAKAVGLTGADASCGRSDRAPAHRSVDGQMVDLGHVGIPNDAADPALVQLLLANGYLPVVACIGLGGDGALYNVNADTFAGHLAARLGAARLVIAGTTPGVLDGQGATLAQLGPSDIEALISGGTATAGMIAKLRACEHALAHGVADVVIVDGRAPGTVAAAATETTPGHGTRLLPAMPRLNIAAAATSA